MRSRQSTRQYRWGIQSLFGGNSIYVELCETAREEAYQLLLHHGDQLGANAIINIRHDANEIMQGITEVLAYGTAVIVEKNAQVASTPTLPQCFINAHPQPLKLMGRTGFFNFWGELRTSGTSNTSALNHSTPTLPQCFINAHPQPEN